MIPVKKAWGEVEASEGTVAVITVVTEESDNGEIHGDGYRETGEAKSVGLASIRCWDEGAEEQRHLNSG